jgi:hypothetical protein
VEQGFLPPEPPGPDPELGGTGTPQEPAPGPHEPAPGPPPWQGQPAYGQGAPAYAQSPPPSWQAHAYAHAPPGGWAPPPGWPPPAPAWQPAQGWGYYPAPVDEGPDNGPAVTGFILSVCAAGLWFISGFLLSPISLILAIVGIFVSRAGKRKIDRGETRKHRGLAQAGFIVGIVTTVVSGLVTLAIVAFVIAVIASEDFREDLDDGDGSEPSAAFLVLRAGARLGVLTLT